MTYDLEFDARALKEWKSLNKSISEQFKKKLNGILENPHIPKNKLSGNDFKNCYKIKLRALGYRLIYKVIEEENVIQVITIGKKDKRKTNIYTLIKK